MGTSFVDKYLELFAVEYERIGFSEDDHRYLGSGGELTEDSLAAALEALRRVPSGIGAQGYFALHGVDFTALKREIAERVERGDA